MRQLLIDILKRDMLPALTLTQPWASLMAHGAKCVETRSWTTEYRGPLALHAAKGFPASAQGCCDRSFFKEALLAGGYQRVERQQNPWNLPLGQVVAIGMLEEVVRIRSGFVVLEPERLFGNYTPGRYAWMFSAVYRLATPIPARGALGVWSWQPEDALWQEVQSRLEEEGTLR